MSENSQNENEMEIPERKTKLWIYITVVGAVGIYAAMFLPAAVGQNIDPMSGYSSMTWSALLFAAIWRYRNRSGWGGAGVVFGIFMFMLAAFVSGLNGAVAI